MAKKDEKLTKKQERFVAVLFETGNQAEAYRQAYDVDENAMDSWIYVEACQLMDNPKVALRLKQLRDQAEDLSIFNRHAAMKEYEDARKLALKTGSASAAVSATNGKVKLFGLETPFRARHEVTGKDGKPIEHAVSVIERKIVKAGN